MVNKDEYKKVYNVYCFDTLCSVLLCSLIIIGRRRRRGRLFTRTLEEKNERVIRRGN